MLGKESSVIVKETSISGTSPENRAKTKFLLTLELSSLQLCTKRRPELR